MVNLATILSICLIGLVLTGVALIIYLVLLVIEFIKAAKSINKLVDATEGEINAMVRDVSETVSVTADGVQALVKRIKFFTGFLEVLGVVSSSVDAFKGRAGKAGAPSKVAMISALAGLKRGIEVLLSEKKK